MQALPAEEQPITGLYIVSDASRAPSTFTTIDKTLDNEDADLWKDKSFLWGKKTLRYFCVSSAQFDDAQNPKDVLTDMALINERDELPFGFRAEDVTVDTKEKCLQKKVLCLKFTPASSTYTAITDVVVLSSRMRRPPIGYTLVGELNSIRVCYKTGKVPAGMQRPPAAAAAAPEVPAKPANEAPAFHRSNTRNMHPLSGVPFEINKKYLRNGGGQNFYVPQIKHKSSFDIDNEYAFDFSIEAAEL